MFLMSEVPLYNHPLTLFLYCVTGVVSDVLRANTAERRAFDVQATWKRELKLPWREAGSPNHHDDKVDLDQ